jgi:hypothetical protein
VAFGWIKTVAGQDRTTFSGTARVGFAVAIDRETPAEIHYDDRRDRVWLGCVAGNVH